MPDPDVEEVLRVIGYAVASHIMCRATRSQSTTGAYEEVLTADLSDLFQQFDVCAPYLRDMKSPSTMSITVEDLNKTDEARLGADFVIALDGLDKSVSPPVETRKVIFVQAKRQDFAHPSPRYATSSNHGTKAKAMAKAVGLANAWFVFYHDDSVTTLPHTTFAWPSGGQPQFFYHWNPPRGTSYYSLAGTPSGFIEPSGYRQWSFMTNGGTRLPDHEWGAVFLNASYFIDAANNVVKKNLPSVAHVLANGACFPQFLLNLVSCTAGEALTKKDFDQRVDLARQLAALAAQSVEWSRDRFTPSFIVFINYQPGRPDRAR